MSHPSVEIKLRRVGADRLGRPTARRATQWAPGALPACASAIALVLAAASERPAHADPSAAGPAQAPAPVGVFGADMPGQGKFVLSLSPSFARSQGNLIGVNPVSAQYIIDNVKSAETPAGDHLLRMVPKSLSVDSQAIGVAYGLRSDVTLSVSTTLVEKSVDMQTFAGLSGSRSLGYSVGRTSGFGDTAVAGVVRVYQDPINRVNVNFGLSLPTGSTTDDITLLTPSGTSPAKRGFYAMQPGSGTVDAMPGVAYSGVLGAWSWGLSYRGRLPFDRNSQGWSYGDLQEVNAWSGYTWTPGLETTLRLNGAAQGAIAGRDPLIVGYGQSCDPLFYGGRQVSLFGGVVVSGRFLGLNATQLGVEAGAPLYQQLNGPQLARDWQVSLSLRYRI